MLKLNAELLVTTRNTIITHYKQFDYKSWRVGSVVAILNHKCGTCACVAGFAEAIWIHQHPNLPDMYVDMRDKLGLTYEQSEFLFYCEPLDDYPGVDLGQADYVEAIKRIDYLLMKDGYDISTLPTID